MLLSAHVFNVCNHKKDSPHFHTYSNGNAFFKIQIKVPSQPFGGVELWVNDSLPMFIDMATRLLCNSMSTVVSYCCLFFANINTKRKN